MASTDLGTLMIWETTDPDEPVCVANSSSDETGLSVSLYRDEDGEIRGVMVHQGPVLLTITGWIPAATVAKELEYATS